MSALFIFSIPLGIKFHNIAVILFLVLCIMRIKWRETFSLKWQEQPVPVLYFLHVIIIVFGLLHSVNLEAGFNDLERAIYAIAVLPIIYLMWSTGESVSRLLKFFSIGCIGVTLFGFTSSWIALRTFSFVEVIQHGHLSFITYADIQPLYLSVYLILVLFFLLETVRIKSVSIARTTKYALYVLCILIIGMIVFLRTKTALLLLPMLLVVYLVLLLKKRGWAVVFLLMAIGILTFLLDKNSSPNVIDQYGAVSKAFDQRVFIWRGALEGIKESPWFGGGTGAAQDVLNKGYQKIGYTEGIEQEFDAHNQYLQFIARNGVVELVVFLAILVYSFWRSLKVQNYTYLMFNILVALVMLTESFLSVQKGIVFFYFFTLAFNYLNWEKSTHSPTQ